VGEEQMHGKHGQGPFRGTHASLEINTSVRTRWVHFVECTVEEGAHTLHPPMVKEPTTNAAPSGPPVPM
jgi:hypothetical protein